MLKIEENIMQIMHMNWKTGKMEPDTPENRICRTAKNLPGSS